MKHADKKSLPIASDELLVPYEHFLLDAFGVLVHASGALPGAANFLHQVRESGKSIAIVTNDSSKLPEQATDRFKRYGLTIEESEIYTSGMLLSDYFRTNQLVGSRCMVLGPSGSEEYVRRAGGIVTPICSNTDYDAVVCCDDAGYPFLDTLDTVVSALFRMIDNGRQPRLILPNPDIIYNKSETTFGFTAGAAAMLLESAIQRRYQGLELVVDRLGKPASGLFEVALAGFDREFAVMIGDQLETDIAGACAVGIDSILVESGIAAHRQQSSSFEPTHRVASLAAVRVR